MATMKIRGAERMSKSELDFEIQRGAKFVIFQYCISALVVTLKRPSDVYFIRAGENATAKGLPFTLLSLLAGWWGIPWGPIYTVQSLYKNFSGGVDVTQSVVQSLSAPKASAPVSPAARK